MPAIKFPLLPHAFSIAAAFIVVSMGLASANPFDWRGPVEPPPPQYAYEPRIEVVIRTMSPDQVNESCGARFERALFGAAIGRRDACASPLPQRCVLYMPPDDGSQWWKDLLAHEKAHCNGWRHNNRGSH